MASCSSPASYTPHPAVTSAHIQKNALAAVTSLTLSLILWCAEKAALLSLGSRPDSWSNSTCPCSGGGAWNGVTCEGTEVFSVWVATAADCLLACIHMDAELPDIDPRSAYYTGNLHSQVV
jgi:hypothetical protein